MSKYARSPRSLKPSVIGECLLEGSEQTFILNLIQKLNKNFTDAT